MDAFKIVLESLFFSLSLLMNACVSLMQEKYEEAETFFEAATCEDEKSILAWTTLGGCLKGGFTFERLKNDLSIWGQLFKSRLT